MRQRHPYLFSQSMCSNFKDGRTWYSAPMSLVIYIIIHFIYRHYYYFGWQYYCFFFPFKNLLKFVLPSQIYYIVVYQKLPMEIICVNLCIYLVIFFLTITKNTSSILTIQIRTILRISCHKWVSQNKSFLLIPLHIKFVKSCKSHMLERKLSFDSN